MASDGPKVSIAIEVDSSQARDALKKFEAALADSAKKQVVSLSGLGGAFGAVTATAFAAATAAIAGLTAATVHYAKIGAEVQANEVRAFAIMERRTAMTSSAKAALLDFNATLQKQIGVDGDAVLAAQATMSAMGVRRKDTESATKAMLGLSAVFGKDIPASAAIVGRVFAGELPKSLQKMGVYAKDAADAQRQLVEMFKVAEAEGQTFAGRVSAAEQAWGDLQETIGLSVVGSGSLKGAIDSIRGALEGLTDYFGSPEGKTAINAFFGGIAKTASLALQAMIGMVQAAEDLAAAWDRGLVGRGLKTASVEPMDKPDRPLMRITQQLADSLAENSKRGADSDFVGPMMPAAGGAKFGKEGGGKGKGPKNPAADKMTVVMANTGVMMPEGYLDDVKQRNAANVAEVFDDYRQQYAQEVDKTARAAETIKAEEANAGISRLKSYSEQMYSEIQGITDLFTNGFSKMSENAAGVITKIGEAIAGAMASFVTQLAEALGGGEEFDGGKFFGGMLKMLGEMAIQTAALITVFGTLGVFLPELFGRWTAALPFAPLVAAAGIAAVAAGTAMSKSGGGSSARGASAGGGGAAGGGWRGGGGNMPFGNRDLSGVGSYVPGSGGGGNVTYQLNFSGPMGGSPRAVARSITDAIDSAGSLKPARRR